MRRSEVSTVVYDKAELFTNRSNINDKVAYLRDYGFLFLFRKKLQRVEKKTTSQ